MAAFRHRNGHPAEEVLEEYSFGRLHGRDCGEVEEHLMLCEPCRESLAGLETFIQSMKTGILEDRESRAYGRAWGRAGWWDTLRTWSRQHPFGANLAWGASLALACLLLVVAWPEEQSLTPAPVALASFRGSQDVKMAQGPAGRPLVLAMDGEGLGDGARVEVVTAAGKPAWGGVPSAEDGKLVARVPKGLRSGAYWVRLYGGDEIVREFGLRLR